MSRVIKNYEAKLKAKVAIEALSKSNSILEISQENNVPKTNVLDWKNKLGTDAEKIFISAYEQEKLVKELIPILTYNWTNNLCYKYSLQSAN